MRYHLIAFGLALSALTMPADAAERQGLPAACNAAAHAGMPSMKDAPQGDEHAGMPGMDDMDGMGKKGDGADPMMQMHQNMMSSAEIEDPDLAFNCGMIAHHQGAIAMAETELKNGKDETSRKLAEAIIAAQREEIAAMTRWIEQRQP